MSLFQKYKDKFIFNFTSPKKRFTEIYKRNLWTSEESVSGPGSEMNQTVSVRNYLPLILAENNVQSMLDIPCGDYYWMHQTDLGNVRYLGADIVDDLIKKNQKKFGKEKVNFEVINLIEDRLPDVDLIFSRDCFIHFSHEFILKSLDNIRSSNAKFFLTNTFPDVKENINIKTGMFRKVNLEAAPYNLPEPMLTYEEEEHRATDGRKLLALWEVSQL